MSVGLSTYTSKLNSEGGVVMMPYETCRGLDLAGRN